MRAAHALGRYGEDAAARHLCDAGFVVLERNWRCGAGEIDIVARDGHTIVVVEVKTRRGVGFGSPLEAVTARKAARLARLGAEYRRSAGLLASPLRIDLVGVLLSPRDGMMIEHVAGVA